MWAIYVHTSIMEEKFAVEKSVDLTGPKSSALAIP
jgi:hypothetical protein